MFISGLCEMAKSKISSVLPKLSPSLLSHYILESLEFDFSILMLLPDVSYRLFSLFSVENIDTWVAHLREDFLHTLEDDVLEFVEFESKNILALVLRLIDYFDWISEKSEYVFYNNNQAYFFEKFTRHFIQSSAIGTISVILLPQF